MGADQLNLSRTCQMFFLICLTCLKYPDIFQVKKALIAIPMRESSTKVFFHKKFCMFGES